MAVYGSFIGFDKSPNFVDHKQQTIFQNLGPTSHPSDRVVDDCISGRLAALQVLLVIDANVGQTEGSMEDVH